MNPHALDRKNAAQQRAADDRNMSKATVTLRLRNAEPVTLPGFAYTLDGCRVVVHKAYKSGKGWDVTEPVTGAAVSRRPQPTRAAAMIEAASLVNSRPGALAQAIERFKITNPELFA